MAEIKAILVAHGLDVRDKMVKKLEEALEHELSVRIEAISTSFEEHDAEGSIKEAMVELMYGIMGNGLYPTEVTISFPEEDYDEVVEELGESMVETDYGILKIKKDEQ